MLRALAVPWGQAGSLARVGAEMVKLGWRDASFAVGDLGISSAKMMRLGSLRCPLPSRLISPKADRCCRKTLSELEGDEDLRTVTRMGDFFSTSTCRDLLFHVQETCIDLLELKDLLARNGVCFLGFDLDGAVKQSYLQRFPDDPAAVAWTTGMPSNRTIPTRSSGCTSSGCRKRLDAAPGGQTQVSSAASASRISAIPGALCGTGHSFMSKCCAKSFIIALNADSM